MKKMNMHLEKITYDNLEAVLDLRVRKEQKDFVASNKISLIEAYLSLADEEPVFPFAICNNDTVVGFLMINYGDDWAQEDNETWMNCDFYKEHEDRFYYYIWRFMIDKKYQGRGYGKEAMKLALDFIRTFPCGEAEFIVLSYEPENIAAKELYRSFGFIEVPESYQEGDEIYAVLDL